MFFELKAKTQFYLVHNRLGLGVQIPHCTPSGYATVALLSGPISPQGRLGKEPRVYKEKRPYKGSERREKGLTKVKMNAKDP